MAEAARKAWPGLLSVSFVTSLPAGATPDAAQADKFAATQKRLVHALEPSARLVAFREGIKYVLAGTVTANGSNWPRPGHDSCNTRNLNADWSKCP